MKKLIFILSLICVPFFSMLSGENNQEIYPEEVIQEKLSPLEITCGTISKYFFYLSALGSCLMIPLGLGGIIEISTTSDYWKVYSDHPYTKNQDIVRMVTMMGLSATYAVFAYKTARVINHGLESKPRKIKIIQQIQH